ncbi:MAG: Flagellar assembly protein FliH [Candidatus Eremiobacteraeota bacterium]|nr:Flagellar assembly protein FliH [Candidatus Eremiobacteraeota bacterium]
MAAEFVSLADLLRVPHTPPAADDAPELVVPACEPSSRDDVRADDADGALRDARLFRARLADAFDDAAARLLRELACEVLARELRLAPCDLAELVRRAGKRAPVVCVRVAACEAAVEIAGVHVVADAELHAGDAIVEVAGGALDARLGVRLATVLEAFA